MRRIFLVPLLFAAFLACEEAGSENDTDATFDTGDSSTDDTDDGDGNGTGGPNGGFVHPGIQVGSEGLFGCEIMEAREVTNLDAQVSGFDQTARELLDARLAAWTGALDGVAGTADGTLSMGLDGAVALVSVNPREGCSDFLWAELDSELAVAPLITSAPMSGEIGIRPDQSRLVLSVREDRVIGEATPTFDVALQDSTRLLLDGPVDAATISLAANWVGCIGATCEVDPIGTFTASR